MLAMSMVYILLQKVLLRTGWFGGDKSRVPLLQFILTSGAERIILKSINKKVTSLALAVLLSYRTLPVFVILCTKLASFTKLNQLFPL